jgi:hypothetical protein
MIAGATALALALATPAVAPGAGPAAPGRERAAVAGPAAEGAPSIPVFRATGLVDSATAATVVHCTNFGTTTRSVYVDVLDANGTFACGGTLTIATDETWTFSTRATAVFAEDSVCSVPPAISRGSLRVGVDLTTQLACTVQIVDPVNATPVFLERLSLYNGEGTYLGFLIFANGFESGSTSSWSATVGGGL